MGFFSRIFKRKKEKLNTRAPQLESTASTKKQTSAVKSNRHQNEPRSQKATQTNIKEPRAATSSKVAKAEAIPKNTKTAKIAKHI